MPEIKEKETIEKNDDENKKSNRIQLDQEEQELLNSLSGRQKCAILLTALGEDLASNVFTYLEEPEIEEITLGLTALKQVSRNVTLYLVEDFYDRLMAQEYLGIGGVEYAKTILQNALGSTRAGEIIKRISSCFRSPTSFSFMKETDISQILYLVQNEHPQVIALLAAYMHPKQASTFISALPSELQAEVSIRIALLDTPSPEIISQLQKVLGRDIVSAQRQEKVGGIEALVRCINNMDRSTEKTILRELSIRNPELAEEITGQLFVFEDIAELGDQYIQLIIREIDKRELALALKGVDENIFNAFARNMSERARRVMEDEMDSLGRLKLSLVEEAQKRIVKTIKKLEEQGLIDLSRGGEFTVG